MELKQKNQTHAGLFWDDDDYFAGESPKDIA